MARHYGLALTCYRPLLVLETLLVVLLAAGIVVDGGRHRWMPYAALAPADRCWASPAAANLMRHRGHEAADAALPAVQRTGSRAGRRSIFVSAGMSIGNPRAPLTVRVAGEGLQAGWWR